MSQYCTAGGWAAKIYVQGRGGDGQYTYAWEGQVKGGPMPGSLTFEIQSAGWTTAIVGEVSVTSAGQTDKVKLFVRHPRCP